MWSWWSLFSKYCVGTWIILYNDPRSTTRPLHSRNCGSNSEFLRWQISINDATGAIWLSVLASSDHLTFVFDFRQLPCQYFLQFSHYLSTAAFASGIFMASGIGINLCTRLWWLNKFTPFPEMWSSWLLLRDPSMYSHGFVGLNNISRFRLVLSNFATGFLVLIQLKSTKYCSWHRDFPLSTSIFHDTLEFFIIRFSTENTT